MQRVFLLTFILLTQGVSLFAQPKWEVNLSAGASNYLGDLVEPPFPYLNTFAPAFGAGIAFVPSPSVAFELNLLNARLQGDDHNIGEDNFMRRSLRFESSLWELNLTTRLEPLSAYRYYEYGKFKGTMLPYFFIGGGITRFDAMVEYRPETKAYFMELIEADQEFSRKGMTYALPFGAGLRIDLNKRHALDIRAGVRPTFTDYLDGVSLSGNPESNDWYVVGSLRFVSRLGDKDSDKDGIPDREDFCPLVAGDISAKGCPDADGDGVEDLEDICPYKFGLLDLNGCPDLDGDGLTDMDDDCPTLPGPEATDGCPDKDGDGVRDAVDWCPSEAGTKMLNGCPDCDGDDVINWYDKCPEVAGSPLYEGCPVELYDFDKDGFPNEVDLCPNVKGTLNGCPDTDGDNVPDEKDKCPEIFGSSEVFGCPVMTKKELELLELATKAIKFETGSAVLKPESKTDLEGIIPILMNYPNYHIEIQGHTDNVGKAIRNQQLSEKRAAVCYEFLTRMGIDTSRVAFKGFGEERPIAKNETAGGRKLNRRVEFILTPYVP